MIVLLSPGATPDEVRAVEHALTRFGMTPRRTSSTFSSRSASAERAAAERVAVERAAVERVAVEATGPRAPLSPEARALLAALPAVECLLEPKEPAPRVRDAAGPVTVGHHVTGAGELTFAFGPCSVDDEEDLDRAAAAARLAGAQLLRGGAYKPRTSPYAFQGMGEPGLHLLRRVADRHGLLVVTEALSEAAVDDVAAHADLIQIGARSMAMTPLLRAAARAGRPVLLKRGFGATVDEWLLAAEYLLDGGAPGVILCERGIRSFEPGTRSTLDVGGLALARLRTRLPVWADPSHAAGTRALVTPLALASVAAGAAGLIVECHADPGRARSDGPQALALDELAPLVKAARAVAAATEITGRTDVCSPPWTENESPTRSRPQSSASPR